MEVESTAAEVSTTLEGDELFLGFVTPVGTSIEKLTDAVTRSLKRVEHEITPIRVTELMDREVLRWKNLPTRFNDLKARVSALKAKVHQPEDDRITLYMDLGNATRKLFGRGDALAQMAINAIQAEREAQLAKEAEGTAKKRIGTTYLIRSLKHPDEVKTLRAVYGTRFFLIGAYAPREARINALAHKIATSRDSPRPAQHRREALKLAERDELEAGEPLGQKLGGTFYLADFFVDLTQKQADLSASVDRFIDLILGSPFFGPTKDEFGMAQAQIAGFRSAALARQVGACICSEEGSVLAVGCNEVPKAFGGQYWHEDEHDQRDIQRESDHSDVMRRVIVTEILQSLQKAGWLHPDVSADVAGLFRKATFPDAARIKDAKKLVTELSTSKEALAAKVRDAHLEAAKETEILQAIEDLAAGRTFAIEYLLTLLDEMMTPALKDAQVMRLNEFGRTVHAEMAAITDAARRGSPVGDATLYTTTFPCHECTRHILSSGIARVVFVEPYSKSYAEEQHGDAIAVDDATNPNKVVFSPFVGIAPRQYSNVFSLDNKTAKRKDDEGNVIPWLAAKSPARMEPAVSYAVRETNEANKFGALLLDRKFIQTPLGA